MQADEGTMHQLWRIRLVEDSAVLYSDRRRCLDCAYLLPKLVRAHSISGAAGVGHQHLRRRRALLDGVTRVWKFDARQLGNPKSAVR